MRFYFFSVNASHTENMAALIEDAQAMAIGMIVSTVISLIFCIVSVVCINWSALRQVSHVSKLAARNIICLSSIKNTSFYPKHMYSPANAEVLLQLLQLLQFKSLALLDYLT